MRPLIAPSPPWKCPRLPYLARVSIEFPATTIPLRRAIVEQGGAIISEYLPDDSYNRSQFVERNRLQAALAHAVCPVEGRLKSGTAHTIQFALRYNRIVFGVRYWGQSDTNEIPDYLQAQGKKVIALDTDEGVEQLKATLAQIPGKRRQPPRRPPPEDFWRPVLDALRDVRTTRTVPLAYSRGLVDEIARQFRHKKPPQEPDADGTSAAQSEPA